MSRPRDTMHEHPPSWAGYGVVAFVFAAVLVVGGMVWAASRILPVFD